MCGVCDGLIVLDQAIGNGDWLPVIVSLFTSANLLVMGALSMSQELSRPPDGKRDLSPVDKTKDTQDSLSEDETKRDAIIMSQLSNLMDKKQLFLDADLTLTRLTRKLGIPAKQVSAAINRQAGENVSRHVNRYRIEHACTLLLEGKNMTRTVFDSGFNIKSNFNREFQRLKLASPSEWIISQSA